jgi:hypothetical protein
MKGDDMGKYKHPITATLLFGMGIVGICMLFFASFIFATNTNPEMIIPLLGLLLLISAKLYSMRFGFTGPNTTEAQREALRNYNAWVKSTKQIGGE